MDTSPKLSIGGVILVLVVVVVLSSCGGGQAGTTSQVEPQTMTTSQPASTTSSSVAATTATTPDTTTTQATVLLTPEDLAQAVATVEEFLAKRASYDIDGLVAMLADGDAFDDGANPYYYETMKQVFGYETIELECSPPEQATVTCEAKLLTTLGQVNDWPPCTETLDVTVEAEKVTEFTASDNCDAWYYREFLPFKNWITLNYPDQVPLMYNLEGVEGQGSGLITDESRDLWFDHMEEYVNEITTP